MGIARGQSVGLAAGVIEDAAVGIRDLLSGVRPVGDQRKIDRAVRVSKVV